MLEFISWVRSMKKGHGFGETKGKGLAEAIS
jgi:hypothetical protein